MHVEVGAEAALRFLPLPATIFISTEKALGSVILRASASTTSSSAVHFRVLEENSQFEMDGDLLRVGCPSFLRYNRVPRWCLMSSRVKHS